MRNEEIKTILNELIEKSKHTKKGFSERKYKVNLTELENINFPIFSELAKIERNLWSSKSNYTNQNIISPQPILEILDDFVEFYPSIINKYLKEIENE